MVSMPVPSSFLISRNEKIPTKTGTIKSTAPTQRNMTAPRTTSSVVEPGFCAITSGICVPNKASAPRHINTMDGKPQAITVATVRTMATVRFIGYSVFSVIGFSIHPKDRHKKGSHFQTALRLTSQFCAHLMLQTLYDLLAD